MKTLGEWEPHWVRMAAVLLCFTVGCRRHATLPDGVSVESQIAEGVSWASLLRDVADLSTVASVPSPSDRSVLFSSSADTNKVCLAHLAEEVLGDMDHGFFYRIEDADGYVEATLAEASGAGAITWIWSANPVGEAVLYVDSEKTPALQMPFGSLLAGAFLPVRYPYAALTSYGHNLHFPIVHTNSIRLALRTKDRKTLSTLFYRVAWNSLPAGDSIHPFDLTDVRASSGLLGSLADRFLRPAAVTGQYVVQDNEVHIAPGESKAVFQSDADGVIHSLDLRAENKTALSDLWLEAHWDAGTEASVFAPVSMLAGTSALCEDTDSLPCSLSGSHVTLRWRMPFGPSSKIVCLNKGQRPHSIRFAARVQSCEKAEPLLRFHANYGRKMGLSLTASNVVTFGEMSGPGHIVGCVLRVDSRSAKWWGEGDEMIWLDQYDTPAWKGTGTEDYFGFAWCSDGIFDHPLRGQTRADGSRTNRRIAAMHRYHLLDRLPFHRSARFDMEAWGLTDGFMDYETTLMWYSPEAVRWPAWTQPNSEGGK